MAEITKPAQFNWGSGIASKQTIQLSATKWNQLVERTEQLVDWENQQTTTNYSYAKVNSKEIISAYKYNIIATVLGVSNVKTGDLITAQAFIALQNAFNNRLKEE